MTLRELREAIDEMPEDILDFDVFLNTAKIDTLVTGFDPLTDYDRTMRSISLTVGG